MALGLHCLIWWILAFNYGQICCYGEFYCDDSSRQDLLIPRGAGINVAFAVHKSENISEKNLILMTNIVNGFLRNITTLYTVEHRKFYTRSLYLFGETVKFMYIHNYQPSIVEEYMNVSYPLKLGNGSSISSALKEVRHKLFIMTLANPKEHAPLLCVLLTTSPPDNRTLAIDVASDLKNIGVSIIAIAVGDDVEVKDVEDIASNKNVAFGVGKDVSDDGIVDSADTAVNDLTAALQHAKVLPSYKICHNAYINVFIIVDVSRNYIETLFQLRDFMIKFNYDRVSMRAMIINSPTNNDWYLRSFQSVVHKKQGFKLETFDSSFNLMSSIRRGRQFLLNVGPYNKFIFHEKIMVIVTDRQFPQTDDVKSETSACRDSGIHIMALGIGKDVPEEQLSQIISDPRGVTTVRAHDEINFGLERLNRNICPRVCEGIYHNGKCYQSWAKLSWKDGKESCRYTMSKLVSVTNAELNSWLKTIFSDDHFIGLRKHTLDNAPTSREFRWESGKPLVYSDWNKNFYYPEPNGSMIEACTQATPEGWIDISCSMMNQYNYINVVCEKDAGNVTLPEHRVEILPLWKENICPLPPSGFNHNIGPIVATGANCTPVIDFNVKVDVRSAYICSNGELISAYLLCDGLEHCTDGSDELNCSSECTEDQFPCTNGRCISVAYFCDSWDDCGDNSDETDCVTAPCSADEWQCDNGQCIPGDARCDLYYDCYDRSDEQSCLDICKGSRCGDGTCIPWHWMHDGIADCSEAIFDERLGSRDSRCYRGRYRELFHLFANPTYKSLRPECCMIFDGFGKHLDSYYDSYKNCGDNYTCPIGFYKCPSSYCIPIERVCDGVMDCINGEEELGCGNYKCPGYFRCPFSTYCHHPARLCDGDADCPGGRDEVMCDFRCPDNCTCFAGVVKCKDLTNQSPFDPRTRKLALSNFAIKDPVRLLKHQYHLREVMLTGVGLTSLEDILNDLINLRKLDISHNYMSDIAGNVFTKQGHLKTLDVSHNPLKEVSPDSFAGLKTLEELLIRYTSLVTLGKGSFTPLVNLKRLDIRWNSIHSVSDGAFIGLNRLSSLHTEGNQVERFGQKLYDGLDSLQELYTDMYSLCCPQVRPWYLPESKCVSSVSAISSCKDLLANDFIRSSIWILCVASLLGNVMSVIVRLVWERTSMKNGYGVFVTHLGISDFLMGSYLLIIAIADISFKGTYIWHDYDWRHSAYCKMAGALATISSEASTIFICLITLDRFIVIKFPFSQVRFRYKSATVFAVLAWIVSIVIAVVPLFPSLSHWNFYSKNGACLALPFSIERKPGWIYSAVIFIGINFISFIIIALGQVSIYRAVKQGSMISSKQRSAQDMAVARRLLLIVVSDFLCWFPVGIMSVLSISGTSISGEAYAWTAVFILPVNSALNPFFYTIPGVLQKVRGARGKQLSTSKKTTESSGRKARVEVGDPGPGLVLLEDVLLHLNTQEEKLNLIWVILGSVKESLQSMDSVQPKPNAVYVGMRGKEVARIRLVRRPDVSHVDPIIYTLLQVMPQQEVIPDKRM